MSIDQDVKSSEWEVVEIKHLTVKLGDFGSSRFLTLKTGQENVRTLTMIGTLAYMAPEVNKAFTQNRSRVPYNHTADIYSAGKCILALFIKDLNVAGITAISSK